MSHEQLRHTVSRQFLCQHFYGAHPQFTFFHMHRPGTLDGRTIDVMCPNRVMNPHIPTEPGTHGLFLNAILAPLDVATVNLDADEDDKTGVRSGDTTNAAQVVGVGVMNVDKPEEKAEDMKCSDPDMQEPQSLFSNVSPCHWRYVGKYEMYDLAPFSPDEWKRQPAKVSCNHCHVHRLKAAAAVQE